MTARDTRQQWFWYYKLWSRQNGRKPYAGWVRDWMREYVLEYAYERGWFVEIITCQSGRFGISDEKSSS